MGIDLGGGRANWIEYDLPTDIDRREIVEIDHHGPRAGADKPSALRQIYDFIGAPRGISRTRRRSLVAANDVGHVPGMRALGVSENKIHEIRDADRKAQRVTELIEVEYPDRRAEKACRARPIGRYSPR